MFLVIKYGKAFFCISGDLKIKQDARHAAKYFPPQTVLQLHKFEAQE